MDRDEATLKKKKKGNTFFFTFFFWYYYRAEELAETTPGSKVSFNDTSSNVLGVAPVVGKG